MGEEEGERRKREEEDGQVRRRRLVSLNCTIDIRSLGHHLDKTRWLHPRWIITRNTTIRSFIIHSFRHVVTLGPHVASPLNPALAEVGGRHRGVMIFCLA